MLSISLYLTPTDAEALYYAAEDAGLDSVVAALEACGICPDCGEDASDDS